MFWGSDEVLAGEDAKSARRLEAAGNEAREVEGGQHSFIISAGWVPEVDDAIAEMGKRLIAKLGR